LESHFTDIAENQPELIARHCAEAGLIEKAVGLRGKAGQRSLDRSALAEAVEQLRRGLELIATLPATPALRREQIKLQVMLANALIHTKGYAAPETKTSFDQARSYIEQAEALGEPPEDPLLLFSVLYGLWVKNYVAFDGGVVCDLAAQFLALAKQQRAKAPRMIGHLLLGGSLMYTGDIVEGRAHLDCAVALYDPAEHRPLATKFGQDIGVANLFNRSMALWLLGYAKAARTDTEHVLNDARKCGQAATLMYALSNTAFSHTCYGDYAKAHAQADELVTLADEKRALLWKARAMMLKGLTLSLMGKGSSAIQMMTSGIAAARSTGSKLWVPLYQAHLARAYAALGQLDDAWRCLGEATTVMEATMETWCEGEVNRVAGEIALKSAEPDAVKAQAYFERALAVARAQQAKSWELRAAMSMARLWRDQGNRDEARDLLAPVYGWFTEGFDTLDLKEAKALLEELGSMSALSPQGR
jgi:predicted ATPase